MSNKMRSSKTAYDPEFMDSAALANAKFEHCWLVESILVDAQPGVIGGESKTLKTSLSIDLAISLGSATPFPGKFGVPLQKRVAVLSGESGRGTVKQTAKRICRARNVKLQHCDVHWSFSLPDLSRAVDRNVLRRYISDHEIEVVILDPLYLLLGIAGAGTSGSNIFEMGRILYRIGRTCFDAGATPLLIHHARKGAAPKKTDTAGRHIGLADLAFSGIGEYARQWILLGRRSRFVEGTGHHELTMVVGGSAGHSGRWLVDVDEGSLGKTPDDRQWEVRVRLAKPTS